MLDQIKRLVLANGADRERALAGTAELARRMSTLAESFAPPVGVEAPLLLYCATVSVTGLQPSEANSGLESLGFPR